MRYERVAIEGFAYVLPEEVVRSDELEERLAPLYDRLRLRVGRLELMTGIAERRFFPAGTRPSTVAAQAGAKLLERTGFDRGRLGALIHASVCRDFLEPATASVVHAALDCPPSCVAYDLSNACLGVANGMLAVADRIELGQIEAGLVVAGENGRDLVEETLHALTDPTSADAIGRDELKTAFASLTIGAGAAAVLLVDAERTQARARLLGGAVRAASHHHELCQGDIEAGRARPLMQTDSEALLVAGTTLAGETWDGFEAELGWTRADVDRVITHQVGVAHRRRLFEVLDLDPALDYPTVERLGNMGSVSLPLGFAQAVEEGVIGAGERVAMLGIGSGLHCAMLGVAW